MNNLDLPVAGQSWSVTRGKFNAALNALKTEAERIVGDSPETLVSLATKLNSIQDTLNANEIDFTALEAAVQDAKTFIEARDTSGELITIIDAAVGGTWWRTNFTAAIQAAQNAANEAKALATNVRQTLEENPTTIWDFSIGNIAKLTLNANRVLNITNLPASKPAFGVLEVLHNVASTSLVLAGDITGVNWNVIQNSTTVLGFYWNGSTLFWSSNIVPVASGGGTALALSTAEVYPSAANQVVLTYNKTLYAYSVPAAADYTVTGGKTVTGVAIDGAKVILALDSILSSTDQLTVSYVGGANKVKDPGNNEAPNFTNFSIANLLAVWADLVTLSSTVLVNNSQVITSTDKAASWGKTGVFNQYIPANQEGAIQFKHVSLAQNKNFAFFFKTTNAAGAQSTGLCGMVVNSSGLLYGHKGSATTTTGRTLAVGDIVKIERAISGGVASYKIHYSADNGITWTQLQDVAPTVTGIPALYIGVDMEGAGGSLSNPKVRGGALIPAA